jgi:hypothetical protein
MPDFVPLLECCLTLFLPLGLSIVPEGFILSKLTSGNYSSVNSVFCFLWYQEIDQPALIPHIAEAKSQKYPYEVLFRSLQKLLIDTATSE